MIDLARIKKGMNVKFRCGGDAAIRKIAYRGHYYRIKFDISERGSSYTHAGCFSLDGKHPFDIVEIDT